MSRIVSGLALTMLGLAGCSDSTAPAPTHPVAEANRDAPAAARERLARSLALALNDAPFRAALKRDLDRSPAPESKLHFQRYLTASQGRAAAAIGRITGTSGESLNREALRAPALELYLPVPAHRAAWKADQKVLVATAETEGEAPVAFSPDGRRMLLSPTIPPAIPVLALVPVETDFDAPSPGARLQGGPSGGSTPPPAGLYLTSSHLVESFESWIKGSPEIEVHLLGQAGASDSLTSYSCAGGTASGHYRFDQNSLDWSGSALLLSQAQLNSYKAAHPNQNLRVFLVEDDDTSCQIKTDPARFSNLIKAVETAYPLLTGGRDSTSGALQRVWTRAHALQRILKALASLFKTNDELIGNAVESAVVGEVHPNSNWIVKGAGNKTNAWIKLEMK